jgi:hypothetical protein
MIVFSQVVEFSVIGHANAIAGKRRMFPAEN